MTKFKSITLLGIVTHGDDFQTPNVFVQKYYGFFIDNSYLFNLCILFVLEKLSDFFCFTSPKFLTSASVFNTSNQLHGPVFEHAMLLILVFILLHCSNKTINILIYLNYTHFKMM